MPDIFDEVADDLRAERTNKLLRRFAGPLVGLIVLSVAAVAGYEAWTQHQAKLAAAQAESYLAAQQIADGQKAGRAEALPAFAALAESGSTGYRTLSRLRAAAIKSDSNDMQGAILLWEQVAADSSADPILRDFANLQWALRQIDTADPSAIAQRLQLLTGSGSVWRSLAQEGLAMIALRQGQTDLARSTFKELAADTTAPDGVRGRANGLLQLMGG